MISRYRRAPDRIRDRELHFFSLVKTCGHAMSDVHFQFCMPAVAPTEGWYARVSL